MVPKISSDVEFCDPTLSYLHESHQEFIWRQGDQPLRRPKRFDTKTFDQVPLCVECL